MARLVNLRRDRFLFYTGLALVLLGGPGFTLGAFAHDSMRVPVIGDAYDAFGWVNQTFLAVGVVVLVVGILFALLGLKGGILSEAEIAEMKREGRIRS